MKDTKGNTPFSLGWKELVALKKMWEISKRRYCMHTAASKRKEKEIENPNDLLDENMRKYRTMIDLNIPK